MRQDRVTSIDVAKEAGVSQSAVSRVFSKSGSASQKTIDKVQQAADKLGYRPNQLARTLITGKSRIIGLLVAYLDNYFYPTALEILSRELQKKGYHVLIFLASQKEKNIDNVLQELLDYQVDGIVTASVSISSDLASKCHDAGIPIVMFNRTDESGRSSSITSDNFQGGYDAAEFFIRANHKKIGYIAGWDGASTQRDREAGFRAGLAAHGRDIDAYAIGNYDMAQSQEAARQMFGGKDYPDAVFVANDHMAFAVMDVMRTEYGLSIPQDVAVIGYDDVPPASWPAYNLTTLRQPAHEMVASTITTLIAQIEDADATPEQYSLPSPMILRGSTR